jgi:hypothetical protein
LEQVTAIVDGTLDAADAAYLLQPFLPSGLTLTGRTTVHVDATSDLRAPATTGDSPLRGVDAKGVLFSPSATYLANQLRDLRIDFHTEEGALRAVVPEGCQLNGGALTFDSVVHLGANEQRPSTLRLGWQNGKAGGSLTPLLRYAVPLLAGLDANTVEEYAGIDYSSLITLTLDLAGPLTKPADQEWNQQLGKWSGNGGLRLGAGAFTAAPPVAKLFEALGGKGRVQFDDLATQFRIADGSVHNDRIVMKTGNSAIYLSGKTRLDGKLDYQVDLSELFKGHRDGQKLLELANGKVAASLVGSVSSPNVDLGGTLEGALKSLTNELLKDPSKALDGVLDIFGRRKR